MLRPAPGSPARVHIWPGERNRRGRAFTYVELMTVLTIITILAAIAVPNFTEARVRASVARSRTDLAVLKAAIESYRLDARAYPPNRQSGHADGWDLAVLTTPVGYLTLLPLDEFTLPEARGRQTADGQPPAPPQPFAYLSIRQARPDETLTFAEAPPYEMSGLVAALLWGYGPEGVAERTGPRYFSEIPAQGPARLSVYDPTNGTLSAGDIFQSLP